MKNKAVDLYFFSGTGNTYLVAKRMAEVLGDKCDVRLLRMETSAPGEGDSSRAIGLAFPVACQSTYPLVWKFACALPEAKGTEAFMVDTMMSFSGGIVGPLRRVMERKGYAPIGAKEITMPLNFGRGRINHQADERKVKKGLATAEAYAISLLEGEAHWGKIPFLPDAMRLLASNPFMWQVARWCGRRLAINEDKCINCGLCASLCPMDNIVLDGYPRFGDRCQMCLRCIAICPRKQSRIGTGTSSHTAQRGGASI